MTRRCHALLSFSLLLPACLSAQEEIAVKSGPFEVTSSLEAVFLPEASVSLEIRPQTWDSFPILDVVSQGALVKKGAELVKIDTRALDKQLENSRRQAELRKLRLAALRRELKDLGESTPRELARAKRTFERVKEDHDYFFQSKLPLAKEKARSDLAQARFDLEYEKKELKQLLKMYEADDLVEETEEIILKRQRRSVERAAFDLKEAEAHIRHLLKTNLLREATDQKEALKKAAQQWDAAQENLPRALQMKSLETAEAARQDALADSKQKEMEADRALMDIIAPQSGHVYHGAMKNGLWQPESALKYLFPGGHLAQKTVFMTIVPEKTPLLIHLRAEQSRFLQLSGKDLQAYATLPGQTRAIPLEVVSRATHPGTDGQYLVTLRPSAGEKLLFPRAVPGMKAKVFFTAYRVEKALSIPASALNRFPDGTAYLKVKLADGQTEKRKVRTGRIHNGRIEIVHGLEPGQIILK